MIVEVKNLVRDYGKHRAVNDISFSFESGHIFGFIGPNGAGKTTTIKVMATLDIPTSGDVYYDGMSVLEMPEKVRPVIGYMPDALPEHNDIKVWEYLDFFARSYGLKGATRANTLEQVMNFTNTEILRDKTLKALSKGMKQRVSLARALVHDPEVLILDEPAAGLDPRARKELRDLLKILAANGKAILISSHILSELQDICTGTVIIEKGHILGAGTLDEVKSQTKPSDEITILVRFLEGENEQLLKKLLENSYVNNASIANNRQILVDINGDDLESHLLLQSLVSDKTLKVVEFQKQNVGLEELFMNVTKGEVQ
ncbi:ABC transporter ATP-binding protein [Lentisphaerota bacterium WC36G]|nr:ABC transporter ATP-binding protein [Lentisphaerae bacterium WC36]